MTSGGKARIRPFYPLVVPLLLLGMVGLWMERQARVNELDEQRLLTASLLEDLVQSRQAEAETLYELAMAKLDDGQLPAAEVDLHHAVSLMLLDGGARLEKQIPIRLALANLRADMGYPGEAARSLRGLVREVEEAAIASLPQVLQAYRSLLVRLDRTKEATSVQQALRELEAGGLPES